MKFLFTHRVGYNRDFDGAAEHRYKVQKVCDRVYFILLVPCRVFVGSAKRIRKDEVLLSPPPRTVIAVSPPSSGSSLRVSPSPAPCLHPHLQPPDLQRRYLLQCCHPLRRSFFVLLSLLLPLQVKASGLQLSRNHPPFAFTSLKTSTGQWKT